MNRKIIIAVVVVSLAGIFAAYLYMQGSQQPVQVSQPVTMLEPQPESGVNDKPEPKPILKQAIEMQPEQPLPSLQESDKYVKDALASLIGNDALMKLLNVERIIRNIVVTIDNLPNERVPLRTLPVKQAHGIFLVEDAGDKKIISQKNFERYAIYTRVAGAINAQKLVELYVRLYPLFQQTYEEIGYPNKYFNDRLLETLDNLLAAPEPGKPIRLAQPHVLYTYDDPDLESRSAGQKILMRMGRANELKIKAWLREIRQQVLLHMQPRKLGKAKK